MKNLLTLFLSIAPLSVLAGEIKNSKTGELIHLNYDKVQKIVHLSSVDHKMKYYPVTMAYCDYTIGDTYLGDPQYFNDGRRLLSCALIPIVNVGTIPLAVGETIILPIQLIGKVIKDQRSRKDLEVLTKATIQDEAIIVSNKRFERITKLLTND